LKQLFTILQQYGVVLLYVYYSTSYLSQVPFLE
jgi:hypothetical protein